MTTLLEYARQQFPGQPVAPFHEAPGADAVPLTSHTLVAHVVGDDAARDTVALLRRKVDPAERVAAVVVRRHRPDTTPTVVDAKEGVVDLANRRVLFSALAGGAAAAIIGFVVARSLASNLWVPLVVAFFFAQAGGMVGSIWGGGARHASNTAVSQPQAPGDTVAVVAAYLHDEARATEVAREVTANEQFDVRIVSERGGWHVPAD